MQCASSTATRAIFPFTLGSVNRAFHSANCEVSGEIKTATCKINLSYPATGLKPPLTKPLKCMCILHDYYNKPNLNFPSFMSLMWLEVCPWIADTPAEISWATCYPGVVLSDEHCGKHLRELCLKNNRIQSLVTAQLALSAQTCMSASPEHWIKATLLLFCAAESNIESEKPTEALPSYE